MSLPAISRLCSSTVAGGEDVRSKVKVPRPHNAKSGNMP